MQKIFMLVSGAALCATAALAAADIPTRYSGSFPSDGVRLRITGTFTGKSLSLRYVRMVKNRPSARTASYACTQISSTRTRCTGTYKSDDGSGGPAFVVVTWSAGKPTAMAFGH